MAVWEVLTNQLERPGVAAATRTLSINARMAALSIGRPSSALAPKKMTGLFFGVLLHSGEDASGPADQTNA